MSLAQFTFRDSEAAAAKLRWLRAGCTGALLAGLIVTAVAQASGGPLQPVSTPAPASPSAGGGGDSWAPILSPDGRYVLFASTANNLLRTSNNTALSAVFPPPLNVFLRDRTNGTTALVSVNLSGTGGGNGNSLPVCLSTNGRFAAFESSASDLVVGDTNNATDVFVRDLVQGTTVLVSVSTNGTVGNGVSRSATMTPDGRYVAFVSEANNLVVGDTNSMADVFVRDLQTQTTTLASVGTPPGSSAEAPDITPDGRYVAFSSPGPSRLYGLPLTQDVYVRDLVGGVTTWASAGAGAVAAATLGASTLVCFNHTLSDDGRFIAYEASPAFGSRNLVPGLILRYHLETGVTDLVHTNAAVEAVAGGMETRNLDMTPDGQRIVFVASTNGTAGSTTCILLWDAATGLCSLVSGDLNEQVVPDATCDWPTIDPTGRWVAFSSTAPGLTTNTLSGTWHLYARDLQLGTTTLLDADTNGIGSLITASTMPCLSANGRFVAFESTDARLVPNNDFHSAEVVVRDLQTGALELVSAREATLPCLSPNGPSHLSAWCVSSDGRYVAFASEADNLVPNDTNGLRDIFVRDCVAGTNLLVSVDTNGFSGDGLSYDYALSADGRYVAFSSYADNLVAGDTNRAMDVFVRDLQSGGTTLVSVNSAATGPGNHGSYSPLVSAGGRYVLFRSQATDLAPGTFGGTDNLFLRDLQAGNTLALTTNGLTAATMSPDGRYVAYLDPYRQNLYLWASVPASPAYHTNNVSGFSRFALSPDGTRLAFWLTSRLYITDWTKGTTWTVTNAYALAAHAGLRFSADNRFLVYAAATNSSSYQAAAYQVYVYDCLGKTNLLVSRSYSSGTPGSGASDWPDISADGRFIAYRSTATNLVPGDFNDQPDIFLYDQQTGATTLLSASAWGNFSAPGRSLCPVFSADGQTLVFQSWGTQLTEEEFNFTSLVVGYSLYSAGAIPVFNVSITSTGRGPWLAWPTLPGKSYHVQFKNHPNDPAWQELGGNVTIVGNQGYCQDLAPAATQRFYRVVGD